MISLTNTYHNAVRDLVKVGINKGRHGQLIKYSVGTDEIHDPTLIAYRVYHNRDDYDVVMVCAGTNAIWQPLPNRDIFLPTPQQLIALKRKYKQMNGDIYG